ncbi:hypothetical protein EVAR_49607_1 [Eumeta japonica]|uniref:Uncharacterized protein n=1 Tax=Eumeta variegata TaxID=151549 RepID=A0A4C1Y1C7_EUMVA|nr:hypothetical protein EVAR_49607_1 [Eumeta japonica]
MTIATSYFYDEKQTEARRLIFRGAPPALFDPAAGAAEAFAGDRSANRSSPSAVQDGGRKKPACRVHPPAACATCPGLSRVIEEFTTFATPSNTVQIRLFIPVRRGFGYCARVAHFSASTKLYGQLFDEKDTPFFLYSELESLELRNIKSTLRLGVTYEKGVTLGNVTMSHRTRERPAECLASLSHSTMIGLPRAALEN